MTKRIGIFDSGIGGFTVLKSLIERQLDIEVYYLADLARNPYGEKSHEEIRSIALEICRWFSEKNLNALLIACNTTNSCALELVRNNLNLPCFDLINSVSEIVSSENIGVLATSATIRSSFYRKVLESKNKGINVFEQSCPKFVYEIEKMQIDKKKIDRLAEIYLRPLIKENVGEIILGCSHYPLIVDILQSKIPKSIKIIDPSKSIIDNFLKSFSDLKKISHKKNYYENVEFFVTAKSDEFSMKVKNWLEINKKITLVNLRTDT